MYKKLNESQNFSDTYPTWIIAYCLDSNSFFATNERYFFWEHEREFECENDAVNYFREHLEEFHEIRSELYLENTKERFWINNSKQKGMQMTDCKFLKVEDATPYHGDAFDHPNYSYTCEKKSREVIPFIYCNVKKCKEYKKGKNT